MNSSTLSTTSIEDLPSEMINELFHHLPLKDLAACSLVNKRWHSIYSNFKLHRLIANSRRDLVWFYDSNEMIREAERCKMKIFFRLVEKPLLSNLKYLALHGLCYFDLNKLNRFPELVHLETTVNGMDGKARLNLPKLRVLAFHHFNPYWTLSIDCPLLSTLSYRSELKMWQLEVKHPETIRKLETDIINPMMVAFKNVQCLVTKEFQVISETTLLSLPGLKELHYNKTIERTFAESRHEIGTVNRLKQALSEFLNNVKKLKGNDFRFRFAGFHLTKSTLDQIDFGVQDEETGRARVSNEYVYMKNYHLIEPGALHFISFIDYSRLLSHVTGEFPRCFSQKFTGIEEVWATAEVPDAHHFLWFLKSLRSLRRLWLSNTKLDQEFYDQLPAVCSLKSLQMGDENGLLFNFDFVDKLPRISDLKVTPLSFELISSLIRSMDKLKEGHFAIRSTDLSISKEKGSKWKIRNKSNPLLFETKNPGEILKFFQQTRD